MNHLDSILIRLDFSPSWGGKKCGSLLDIF